MKKTLLILILLLPAVLFGQQFPFMEGYNVNPFSLSPAYAGIHNSKTVFIDYRSDWTGLEGGPTTYQLSYNDKIGDRIGVGGRFIYDKTDIFKQMLLLGTYTYEVHIAEEHAINFGLSLGLYRNSIDLAKYYNDPDYVEDLALMYGSQTSKIKFATDISAMYRYSGVEIGILFSNIMFGTARYSNTDLTYKPLKNYLAHASYNIPIDDKWAIKPSVIFRGGENIPSQFEIAPSVTWNDRFWFTALYWTGGIFGAGIGGEIVRGIVINYSYNMSTNVSLNTFGSHQVSLGIRLYNPVNNRKNTEQ